MSITYQMKVKFMLKFSSNILIILFSFGVIAQEKKKDTIVTKPQRYGLRVGVDLSKLARAFYEKEYKGLEIVGDYRLSQKFYLAGELGNENKTVDDERVNFTTKGTYFKLGIDFNGYENWLDMENMIHIGMRYGVSSFSQNLNNYKVYDTSNYFPQAPAVVSNTNFNGLSAQWLELVAGVKAKLINNLFLGFSFRMNYLTSNKKPESFDNLYIPGFNRTYDGKFGAGFNYTLTYFVPLYKSKSVKKVVDKKESEKLDSDKTN
jgi:hypothetical protein